MTEISQNIQACQLCADRFAETQTAHAPRPVTWFDPAARILIAGQAPGARVHQSGKPFTDPSGDRLRDWLGLDEAAFYDRATVAIVPMAFCFPGYDAKGSDLPPPPICAATWHGQVMESLVNIRLRVLIGAYAIRWHLGVRKRVSDVVSDWRAWPQNTFVLPHPSWRNTAWLRKNPWFEDDVLPRLRTAVEQEVQRR